VLAAILNAPRNELDWQRFGFHHRTSHDLIRQAIKTQTNGATVLADYQLYPIDLNNPRYFLEWNQSAHTDMNGVLGVPSINLIDVDIDDERQLAAWVWSHYLEHRTAEDRLRIGS
jgi:hypothetical protein